MPAAALVDTGAVVALFNALDPYHLAASHWFRDFRGQFLTTDAVVTETAYVLADIPVQQRASLIWFERMRNAKLMRISPVPDYAAIVRIMQRYADLRCDYADATLVDLAERTDVVAIATVDQRDFSVYRARGTKRFRILLAR